MPSGFGCVMYSKEHPPLAAVPEEFAELPAVVRRGDDGNLTDARQKENRQWIYPLRAKRQVANVVPIPELSLLVPMA